MKQSHADPVIDEIRAARHRISARVDHEPARLVAYYIELQKRYEDRFVVQGNRLSGITQVVSSE